MADNVIVRVPEQQFIKGKDGKDGASAYEQAVAGGYTGTEEQFNAELGSFGELSEQAASSATTATTRAEQAKLAYYRAEDAQVAAEAAAAQALIRMNSADQSAQSAAGSASNASRDAGTASTAATTATTKAGEASNSATAADGSAKDSEAYAIGKRGGTDVGSTDPAYHNNAKYYAEQAASSASDAVTAKGAAETAQGKAEDAQEAAEQAQEAAEAVLESIPEDYTELSEDVDDLKSALSDNYDSAELLTDIACVFKSISVSGQPNGWKLQDDGYCVADADYKLVKYAVTAGSVLNVISDDHFQFQNNSSVPSSGTLYRIGKTYGKFKGLITVPEGATYIIFSTPITDGNASATLMVYNGTVPFWNNTKGGIYIDGSSIRTNQNGFGLYIDGKGYYIAPTDQTTHYAFTGSSGSLSALVIDKTKLTNVNARNNPNAVMSIVGISGSNFAIDPKYEIVAIWYKSFWTFYGVFQYFCDYMTSTEISNAIDNAKAQINPELYLFNLCSHRGLATQQNNTIDAFEAAREAGYKFMECDLRFTSDTVCVLYHDATVNGTAISSMTYAQLHAAADYIPTLSEMLLWAKKNHIAVEFDCAGRVNSTTIQSVYAMCRKYGMLNTVIFCGTETELLYLANNALTSTAVCVSFSSTPTASDIANLDDKLKLFPFRMCSFNIDYVSDTLIEAAHNEGYNVQVWTLTEQTQAQTMYEKGVDTLLCDASTLWNIA